MILMELGTFQFLLIPLTKLKENEELDQRLYYKEFAYINTSIFNLGLYTIVTYIIIYVL